MKMAAMCMALLMLVPGVAAAAGKPTVHVAFMDFTGYAERDAESGEVVGKGVQLVRKLFNEAGYPVQMNLLPPARIWQGLENGTVHVWPGMLNKPDLDQHVLVSERDLGRVGISLYHLPGTPAPRWPDDLQDCSVITITNFTYTADIWQVLNDRSRNLTVHRSSSHEGALQMLERGRGDYLLNYRTQVDSAARELGMEPLPGVPVVEMPMRFVFSRKSGFAEQLRADLDAAFDRLQAQGVELDVTRQQAE
ncbi:substrate-binding periplasmic protein [Halopseudomonas pertucinogena]|uniref:Polar amino acid transport system substrate-binding protein n=1 Tax=Halopseudomonas pertucinogena TaxID=86175 RepID=A0ABQ2CPF9_9GAMM|nr:transporter substrate-binding domain-containing protein [Halopseudomonas pertucinogena]GGJ00169.1 hypothetical protein GCM10009083_16150 [Halopseudomonas pertucinogena]